MEASASSQSSLERRSPHMLTGAYTLRTLLADVPLSAEGPTDAVRITCVELWNENLYIGTSAAEILHFVLIPPDPSDPFSQPSFILASRLQPVYTQSTNAGVQQILVLPAANKACILCNNTLTFYTLPELSPAFAAQKPLSCMWVGGVDLNADDEDGSEKGVAVMICLRSRIQLVEINGHAPRRIRNIEFGGCLTTERRDDFACAADGRSYALLDVVHQQKIPLFPISSLDEQAATSVGGASEDISSHPPAAGTAGSSSGNPRSSGERGHSRNTSRGLFGSGDQARIASPSPRPGSGLGSRPSSRPASGRYGFDAPQQIGRSYSPSPARSPGPAKSPEEPPGQRISPPSGSVEKDKALPPVPPEATPAEREALHRAVKTFTPLKPLIASPTPNEFLLTTGTAPDEPGVGMFVNLDGDVVRGTLEFSSYPDALVVDGSGFDPSSSVGPGEDSEEGYVLAVMNRVTESGPESGVEIQRWDLDSSEANISKEWLDLSSLTNLKPTTDASDEKTPPRPLGIRTVLSHSEVNVTDISDILSLQKLELNSLASTTAGAPLERLPKPDEKAEARRRAEELEFTSRLCKFRSRIVLWNGTQVWWVVRNPLIVQLDAQLVLIHSPVPHQNHVEPDREKVEQLLNSIRGQEPRTEAEFLGLNYIRQKASLLLFIDLIIRTTSGIIAFEINKRMTEEALTEGEVDPRIILTLIPILRDEVVQGEQGIWVQGGLKDVVENFLAEQDTQDMPIDPAGPFGDNLLQPMKRYLLFWRRKKGFGSIADENEVFHTVDAALLHLLLLMDSRSPQGPATAGSIRAELNALVDNGVDCFERAIALLEQYNRLYVLSRLYQSRKMSSMVLATWRRILDGERDDGGDFADGEQEVRKYLSRIRDQAIVEEYGTWLANRNPKLGVQIFADENSRIKFKHAQAVKLLKQRAPAAVKEYLEYLVYGKKQTQYANDLISYYLDIVVHKLETSSEARSILLQTYETYRALRPPKPTYRQFITENGLDAEWWHSRLRLLQLLGNNQGAASDYDVGAILSRLSLYEQELVPEMIILNGRQGRHEESIRLLTHGLGDFDTAISYCLLGGSSIFRPSHFAAPAAAMPTFDEQARLFGYLLHEFLRIEDFTDRMERTGELLERFGSWFDVAQVLGMIPDEWGIDVFSGFLISALRRLVRERNETGIAKALSGARSLQTNVALVEKMEGMGPVIVLGDDVGGEGIEGV
ncbi:hypothetical protein K490DRAFT_48081 [Saccharata proteae CBS 121410]|uniref:CNH domain-containing protein n=1 Tax=Saccharata proteae CBS 121410 TaxID=1314787 RepID=A0A9P4HS36_9PEZI|nr:hypothetical protein K490DRAFT_48081 [Saccharata proteae CBS 121410]